MRLFLAVTAAMLLSAPQLSAQKVVKCKTEVCRRARAETDKEEKSSKPEAPKARPSSLVPVAQAAETTKEDAQFAPQTDAQIRDSALFRERVLAPADFGEVTSGASTGEIKPAPKVSYAEPPKVSPTTTKVVANAEPAKPVVVVHSGKPFNRKTDQLGLVNAVRTCDRKVLIVLCSDLLNEYNRVIGARFDRHFANLDEAAAFLADAEEGPCPVGEMADLSRVLGTRVRARDNWRRPFERGERCLSVDNKIILSLRCGNPVKSTHYLRAPKRQPVVPPSPAPTVRSEPKVVFLPPPPPIGKDTIFVDRKVKGFPTKRVIGGLVLLGLADQALCQWVDHRFCLVRMKQEQEQHQSQ